MSNRKRPEEEGGLSELLQLLDAEAEGPSSDDDNQGEPELEPKHKIFLSHSGAQKDFTDQLCVDLERWHYHPFFDKRADSLPKGRKFPELIFQAAQQCHVAVLILSKEFFTRTKWPMLELEAFVDAEKKDPKKIFILPVYLGISRDECTKNEAIRSKWLCVWRKWAEGDDRIDVEKWEKALSILGSSNGIKHVKSIGEVKLREQIVNVVRGLTPVEITRSGAQIQGRTRICEAIIEKFVRTKPSTKYKYGVRVVGIHGTGGVGKTTFCKVLCDELSTKFQGRVCHRELGTRSPSELQKQILRDLTDLNHGIFMHLTDVDTTTKLLTDYIHKQRVFLALDNVWQDTLEEAKVFLGSRFCPGSIVMVTARSIDLVGYLNVDKSDCLEMPELEEEDAKELFLHHAARGVEFKSEDVEQNILYCVNQCKFQKGAMMDEHFHPLALKVLGAQLGSLGWDPSIWAKNLLDNDKFNQFGEKEHPILNVLRRGYDSLLEEDQLLFMDGVLFHPWNQAYEFYSRWNPNNWSTGHEYPRDIFEWLSIVHQTEIKTIKIRLQHLKAKSLLENIGDGFNGVSVHDLYLEFAKMEVKRGDLDIRRWVWYREEKQCPEELARMPSGSCWQDLKRVYVKYNKKDDDSNFDSYEKWICWMKTIEGLNWQHFSNIVALHLALHQIWS